MNFKDKIKDFLLDSIEKGYFIIRNDRLVFPLNFRNDDRYLYRYGDKWRVIIPWAKDPDRKISLGYYRTKQKARKVRDAFIRRQNRKYGDWVAKKI